MVNDIQQAIACALWFAGRKRTHTGDEFMARVMADRHLELSGFPVTKKPPAKPHTT